MSINLQSEQFKNNLYNLINNSGLPIANVYFILKATGFQLEQKYYEVINSEYQQMNENPEQET